MPILKLDVKEQYKSIVRPTILAVVNQIMPFMNLNKNVEIIFKGDADIALMQNGQIGVNHRHPGKPIRTVGSERLFITTEIENTDTTILEMPVEYPEHRYIFWDDKLNIKVKPVRRRTKVNVRFGYRFRSKAAADQWKSSMDMLLAQKVQDYIHNVTYHYAYPDEAVQLLYKLWEYRGSGHVTTDEDGETCSCQGDSDCSCGDTDTFNDYFLNNSIPRITAVTDQAGNKVDIAVAETMTNVQGWWDFDITPEADRVNSVGNYQTNFNYVFEFDKVIGLVMYYPIMIYQQLLPPSFIPTRKVPTYKAYTYEETLQQSRFARIRSSLSRDTAVGDVVYPRHPDYDEWLPEFALQDLAVQYHALLSIDCQDPQFLVNLDDLGDYEFSDDALAYIRRVGDRVFRNSEAIIQIRVYQGRTLIDSELLSLDDTGLSLRTTIAMSRRYEYRVVITVETNLCRLLETTVTDLLSDGAFVLNVLSTIYPDKQAIYPEVDEFNRIMPMDWSRFVAQLGDTRKWVRRPITSALFTGQYSIITRKR